MRITTTADGGLLRLVARNVPMILRPDLDLLAYPDGLTGSRYYTAPREQGAVRHHGGKRCVTRH